MSHREIEKTIHSLVLEAGMESILYHLINEIKYMDEPYIQRLRDDLTTVLADYQSRNHRRDG